VTGTVKSYTPSPNEVVLTLQSKHIPFPPQQILNLDDTRYVLHETLDEIGGGLDTIYNHFWRIYTIPIWSSSTEYVQGTIVQGSDGSQYILTPVTSIPRTTDDPILNTEWLYLGDYSSLTYIPNNFLNYTVTTSKVNIVTLSGSDLFVLYQVTSLVVLGSNKDTYNAWFTKPSSTVSASWRLSLGSPFSPRYPTTQVTSFQNALQQISLYACCRFAITGLTPAPDLTNSLNLPSLVADGTHLVVVHESLMDMPPKILTVAATNTTVSPSTLSVQMASEVLSFVKNNDTWSYYSGF
jgi:hypothetical protein